MNVQRPRVLVLNQFALPRSAAGGTRHVEIFGRLVGWETRILAGRRSVISQEIVADEGLLKTVPVTPYRGNGWSRVLNWASYSAIALLRGIVSPKPTVVYGSSPHLGAALAGLLVAKVRRAAFVLEVRDLWPQILVDSGMMPATSKVYRVLRKLEKFLYQSADRIVILAEGSGPPIVALGIAQEKLVFIPNGADPADFEPDEDRDVLRRRYGFEGFTAVYAGAHGPANGLDLVLDAASDLVGEDIHFALVGDGVVKQALVDRARVEDLSNVHFLDPIPKTEMANLLAAADVGLHSLADVELFKTGVSPNKLYDYMAAGLPALTNTGGDVAQMVLDAGSGLAVEPTGMAEGMRRLASMSEANRAKMSASGIAFMEAERSRSAMAARLVKVFEDVTA